MSEDPNERMNETYLCCPVAAGIRRGSKHNLAAMEEGETADIQIRTDPDGYRIHTPSPEEDQKEHHSRNSMKELQRGDEPT